ncbi:MULTISPECIES: phage portal protein [unclassified Leisingera]|uniref:phage portal protein n=1 Tax=unclassified Leisingera TaxID=2614906 RepID=UPI0002DA248E|nr:MULTISPECIES: phage portal protein [unclassified Leisingera]KIC19627.1 phage portal protein [Leisingera sp. ANG-DT]KIC54493.1 phage portal protein [Leisingera sp. ANG-S]KID10686.1 phage portal protein [Leisingera sp. ANG1]
MKLLGFNISRASSEAAPVAERVEPPMVSAQAETSGTSKPEPWLTDIGFGGSAPSNKRLPRVTPQRGEQHGTVFACCNNLGGDLSKVPLKLWQRMGDGQEVRVREHPANYLLNVESSPGVPAKLMRYGLVYAWALRGNSYAYGPRDGGGELEMIELALQDSCSVLRAGRERFYDFTDGAGVLRRVPSRSMVHMRYMALDGWTGRSPLQVASETVGLAFAGQESAARSVSGGHTKAVIKLADNYESAEDRERNARNIKAHVTKPGADGIPVLGPDDDIKSLDLTAADQQLLESRKFDREQLAAIYRMPPSKLQMLEFGVKANGEQQAIDYLTDCLLHWSGLAEATLALSVLTRGERERGFFLRHDFGALLQPTVKERNEALNRATGGPFQTPNESRRMIGLPPVEGGDELNPAPNMTRDDSKQKKGKEE